MQRLQIFVVVIVLVASSCVVDAIRRYPKPNIPPKPGARNMCRVTGFCRNGGTCKTTRSGSWRCECRTGWTGSRCTKSTKNFCPTENVCMNGGRCVNSQIPGLFWRCKCQEGFTGRRCEREIPKRGSIVIICEKKKAYLRCPPSQTIRILSANFGRTEGPDVCPHKSTSDRNCLSSDSQKKVMSICEKESECILEAKNSIFGDPCRGTFKYLSVEFLCTA